MPEKVAPGPVSDDRCIREAVCIHTKKIFDSCKDKDCIEDLRVYPTCGSQEVLDRALSVKAGTAELLYAYIDVEPVGFNRGFYTVDVRYFYRITADAFIGAARPIEVCGLAVFDKRAILFGSEGSAKIFSSKFRSGEPDIPMLRRSNLPEAVVEAVDPIVLDARLVESGCSRRDCDCDLCEVPPAISQCFGGELCGGDEGRRIYITLGQFSIVRLERDSQLLVPVYDYCMPEKECSCGSTDDPCSLFRNINFPVGEFFPPNTVALPEDYEEAKNFCACCHK